jgi:hypothetical protein
MGSNMPSRQDEEFELVLGNKQLLSLFFVVVVLFAIFFSFGYTVGFSRGQQDRVVAIASNDTPDPEATDVRTEVDSRPATGGSDSEARSQA